MDDYISREEALDKLNMAYRLCASYVERLPLELGIGCVKGLPSADVEPARHSYWESYDTSQYMGTDEFGEPKWRPGRFYVCHNRRCRRKTAIKSNYCPNCGAKMDMEGGNG